MRLPEVSKISGRQESAIRPDRPKTPANEVPMSRSIAFSAIWASVIVAQVLAGEDQGSGAPPLTYELMINGESFVVEADRHVKLESRDRPGVTYEVALRIALEQRVRLNSFRFEYDWPAKVSDDRRRPHRTVRIEHELRYTMLITDLGGPLNAESQEKALKVHQESTVEGFKRSGVEQDPSTPLPPHEFAHSAGRGFTIRYRDGEGYDHTCLVYVIAGSNFSGYCLVEYFDADAAAVLPQVKKTLDSIEAIR
jgi:hypothetical protein